MSTSCEPPGDRSSGKRWKWIEAILITKICNPFPQTIGKRYPHQTQRRKIFETLLKVQACKLYSNKYMIASTQT